MHMLPFLYLLWYIPTVNVWIWTLQKHQKSSLGRAAGQPAPPSFPFQLFRPIMTFTRTTCKQKSTPAHFQHLPSKEKTQTKIQKMERRCREKPSMANQELALMSHMWTGELCLWGKAAAHPSCQKQPRSSLAGVISSSKSGMLCRFRKTLVLSIAFNLVPEKQLCRNKELRLQWVTLNTIQQHCTAGKTKIPVSVNRTALCKACTIIPVRQRCWDQSWNDASSWWLDFKMK